MSQFLQYLFDTSPTSPIVCSVKQEWCKHYDVKYVEDSLIGTIHRLTPIMNKLAKSLDAKALGLVAAAEEKKAASGIPSAGSKRLTVPLAPNITKPRPRRVPEPMKITNDVNIGPAPTYLERTSLAAIERAKEEKLHDARVATLVKYENCSEQPFVLHETRSNMSEVRRRIEEKREAELQFGSSHRKPLPDFTKVHACVKLNTAAILREDALFKKKQAEEASLLSNYERDLRDSTEYFRWKTTMEGHDDAMKLEQVKLKRLSAESSTQNARDAIERQLADNKAVASLIKEEAKLLGAQRALEEDATLLVNKQLVAEIKVVEAMAPRLAESNVFQERQAIRVEQKKDLKLAWERKVAEDTVVAMQKMDKIRQLRSHAVHKPEVKVFDPTTSAGLGLLDEMSLVEMEERLEINKVREETTVVEKRRNIVANKAKKQAQLSQRIDNIARIRQAAKESNAEGRKNKKEESVYKLAVEEREREIKQVMLASSLMASRESRKKEMSDLANEEERRRKDQMFHGAAAHHVEETHFDQLLYGAEREAKNRQKRAKEAAAVYEQTKQTARNVVEREAKQKQNAKKALYSAKDLEIKEFQKDLLQKEKAEVAHKKNSFAKTRMKEVEIKAKLVDRNVYASKINTMSLSLAKTAAMKASQSKSNMVAALTAM